MVVIRLARAGAKKRPFYHIVVTDHRRRRDSNYIANIGFYNPIACGQEVPLLIELEQLQYWQGQGAQLSDRVASLAKQYKKAAAAASE